MTLGSDLAAALPLLRAAAESRMTDKCQITTAASSPVLNVETGEYETAPGTVVYVGPCELKMGGTAPRPVDAAGQALIEQHDILKLPMAKSTAVKVDQVAEILSSETDPMLVGLKVRILGPFAQTYATARRFPVELISGA